jgi:transposase
MKDRYTLSDEEQEKLRAHTAVRKCTARSITYTPEFKRSALARYKDGETPKMIFAHIPIPRDQFGEDYEYDRIRGWKAISGREGKDAFTTERRGRKGMAALQQYRDRRKLYTSLTESQKVQFLEAENEILKDARILFPAPQLRQIFERFSQLGKNTKS